MEEIQKREKKGKEGRVIKYDKSVIDNENTDIIVKLHEDEDTLQNVALFILKYNLEENNGEQIPYQVVLGMIKLERKDSQIKEDAKTIRDLLLLQLKRNAKGENVYNYCDKLNQDCIKNRVPFVYTNEGIDIITRDEEGEQFLERTYKTIEKDGIMKSKSINPNLMMDLQTSREKISSRMKENTKRKMMTNTAKKELSDEQQENFERGKYIDELRREDSLEVILAYRKRLIITNMVSQYKKREDTKISISDAMRIKKYLEYNNIDKEIDPKMIVGFPEETTEMEKYFRLKEKSIAIDIKKMLEDTQNDDIERQIENGIEDEDRERANYINECKNVFDLIKQGRDQNARFCYSHRLDNGFKNLKSIIDSQLKKTDRDGNSIYNCEEIKSYIQMKEQILRDVKLEKGNNYLSYDVYSQNLDIQKFVEFVMSTNTRDVTREEEKEYISGAYKDLIDRIIERHVEDVKLYNKYAERYSLEKCPVPIQIEKQSNKSNSSAEFRPEGEDR